MFFNMPRWSRLGAFVIDATTINALTGFILSLIPNSGFFLTGSNFALDVFNIFLIILFQVLIACIYTTILYKYAGGTFGKFFLKVNIVDENDEKLSSIDIFKREQLKWTLIYSTLLLYVIYGAYCVLNKKIMLHEKMTKTHIL